MQTFGFILAYLLAAVTAVVDYYAFLLWIDGKLMKDLVLIVGINCLFIGAAFLSAETFNPPTNRTQVSMVIGVALIAAHYLHRLTVA